MAVAQLANRNAASIGAGAGGLKQQGDPHPPDTVANGRSTIKLPSKSA